MPWTIDFEDVFEEDLPLSEETPLPSTPAVAFDDELSEEDELHLAALIEIVDEFDFEAVDEPPIVVPVLSGPPDALATIPSGPPDAITSDAARALPVGLVASENTRDQRAFAKADDPPDAPAEGGDRIGGADPFVRFVRIAEDVARQMGGDPSTLAAFLDEHGRAWRAVLRGESNDLGACGAMSLDEWTADAIAKASGAPTRASSIRQELRARGVAAFGLLADAA